MNRSRILIPVFLVFLILYRSGGSYAETEAGGKVPAQQVFKEEIVKTTHSVLTGNKKIAYDAYTGFLHVTGDNKKRGAGYFFFISYIKKGTEDKKERPVLFSFNGGPGSSSVWLHLGLLGPKRVRLNEDGSIPSPPFRLVENEYSLLDIADLVFIDPVGTGFSRQGGPEDQDGRFHGVADDIESVGDFIRLYLARFQRWTSPKFLIGESYGTTRAAGLSGYLQDRHGIYLNGIMLISSVLDHQTLSFSYGNDLPYSLFLPSYAAAAWYHGRAGKAEGSGLEDLLKEAESFALGAYASALLKGTEIPEEEFERTAAKLSDLTSLSPGFIRERNLRVSDWEFFDELLKDDRQKTGRLDSRFSGFDVRQLSGENGGFFSDPSYSVIQGPYTETLNDYISSELNFKIDLVYEIISHRFREWRQGPYEGRYINVTDTLGKAMVKNPYLKVFVASGYFDLATPYFATKYTFNHLYLPENLKRNISFGYYRAGHMMYIDMPSLKKLRSDLANFISGDGA